MNSLLVASYDVSSSTSTSSMTSTSTSCNELQNYCIVDESIAETISILKRQEDMIYCTSTEVDTDIDVNTDIDTVTQTNVARKHMIEWCYQVIDYCQLQKSTVEIAMSYFDRFIQKQQEQEQTTGSSNNVNIDYYQLACMTCLYIAIKTQEPLCLDLGFMSKLSQYVYTEEQFKQMECTILTLLQYYMNPPTTYEFVQLYLQILVQQQKTSTTITVPTTTDAVSLSSSCMKKILWSTEMIEKIEQKTYQRIQSLLVQSSFSTCTMKPSIIASAAIFASLQEM